MNDLLIALVALIGVAAVAFSGVRFVRLEDDRFGELAEAEGPALWTPAIADEVAAR